MSVWELVVDDRMYRIRREMSLQQIAMELPPRTWESVFTSGVDTLEVINNRMLEYQAMREAVVPSICEIFKAFYLTPLPSARVVIIGQDPYHKTVKVSGQTYSEACGLSFSGRRGFPIPASLRNIFLELKNTIPDFGALDGNLDKWADQGVLLLNRSLTVSAGGTEKAGGHVGIWDPFIELIVAEVVRVNPRVIFVLWGKEAQAFMDKMPVKINYSLRAAHPSPLNTRGGFLGCNHFSLINERLAAFAAEDLKKQIYDPRVISPINWSLQ